MKKCLLAFLALLFIPVGAFAESRIPDKAEWVVTASHSSDSAKNIADGNPSTVWHSPITTPKTLPPFEIEITLPRGADISGLIYTPRDSTSDSGLIRTMEIYAASEGEEYSYITTAVLEYDKTVKTIEFACNLTVKKLKLVITEGKNGYGVIAELDFRAADTAWPVKTAAAYADYAEEVSLHEMDRSTWTATSTSNWNPSLSAQNVLDSGSTNIWHYFPGDEKPIVLDIDTKGVGRIAAFSYTPRPKDKSGHWITYSLLSSLDGKTYQTVIENGHFDPESFDTVTVRFPEEITARYLRFSITEGENGHVACKELKFYQFKSAQDEYQKNNREEYVMTVGQKAMIVRHGQEEETVALDVAPFIVNGTTLIPLRGLLEAMGAEVLWNGANDQITLKKSGTDTIVMQIENELVYVGKIRYTLRVAPRIESSRTFIPLRFVSEHLGYLVDWNGETKTITITKPL